jgi:purine-binding chemotaxis protein CheW
MDLKAVRDRSGPGASAPPGLPDASHRWVVFRVDASRYALSLASVVRIVRAAQVTPLPLAPAVVLGAIDVAGDILPVFNLRQRFRLRERALDPADHFLLARTKRRTVALLIDDAIGVVEHSLHAVIESESLALDLAHVRGVMRLPDGLVIIQDLEAFLSPDESAALDSALLPSTPQLTHAS